MSSWGAGAAVPWRCHAWSALHTLTLPCSSLYGLEERGYLDQNRNRRDPFLNGGFLQRGGPPVAICPVHAAAGPGA